MVNSIQENTPLNYDPILQTTRKSNRFLMKNGYESKQEKYHIFHFQIRSPEADPGTRARGWYPFFIGKFVIFRV